MMLKPSDVLRRARDLFKDGREQSPLAAIAFAFSRERDEAEFFFQEAAGGGPVLKWTINRKGKKAILGNFDRAIALAEKDEEEVQ